MSVNRQQWPRCIAHLDMVAFFASIEQLDEPTLQGQPVAVINSQQGTTIITASYEARAYGIRTGTKVKAALAVCPDLVIRVSRSARYAEMSGQIFHALSQEICPDIEMFSIDEAFFNLTSVLNLYPSVEYIGDAMQAIVARASGGLKCSIGISEGKLTAKFCTKQNKGAITIVPPANIRAYMQDHEVADICGVGASMQKFLYQHGIKYCREMPKMPMAVLAKKMGNIGKRLYLTSQGHDPEPLKLTSNPKSMGHSKMLPPNTRDYATVEAILHVLTERLCQRLRANQLKTDTVTVSAGIQSGYIRQTYALGEPTYHGATIWPLIAPFFTQCKGQGLFSIGIQAGKLYDAAVVQADMFAEAEDTKQSVLDNVKDAIQQRYGQSGLKTADMLRSGTVGAVISPGWRDQHDGGLMQTQSGESLPSALRQLLTRSAQYAHRYLQHQLQQAGLSEDYIAWLLRDEPPDDEKINRLLEEDYATVLQASPCNQATCERISKKLGRQGFRYRDIFRALRVYTHHDSSP